MLVSSGSVMYSDGAEDPVLPIESPSVINADELLKGVSAGRFTQEEAARAVLLLRESRLVPQLHSKLGDRFALELCRHDDWFCISKLVGDKTPVEFAVMCAKSTSVSHRGFQGIFHTCQTPLKEWERIIDAWIDGFKELPYAIPAEFQDFGLTLEIPPSFDNVHISFSAEAKLAPLDELSNQLSKAFTLASKLEWKELKPLLAARKERVPENVKQWLEALLECEVPQKRARLSEDD